MEHITAAVQELQDTTDLIDEVAAKQLGINRTDLRCLSRISAAGRLSPGQLATATGLTGAAITTAIDRLERADLAHRVRDTEDRRRVQVELTDRAHGAAELIWGPIVSDAKARLAEFTTEELGVIRRFLDTSLDNQRTHAERLKKT